MTEEELWAQQNQRIDALAREHVAQIILAFNYTQVETRWWQRLWWRTHLWRDRRFPATCGARFEANRAYPCTRQFGHDGPHSHPMDPVG